LKKKLNVNARCDFSDPQTILKKISLASLDAKGIDLIILDMNTLSSVTDYFFVVTGRSDRQVQGISNRIVDLLEEQGLRPLSIDGMDVGHWVVLDYGEVMVHVFYEADRQRIDLEGYWLEAPRATIELDKKGEISFAKFSKAA
jgi:ribosome-associated protein